MRYPSNTTKTLLAIALCAAVATMMPTSLAVPDNHAGTIKVHDNATADPEVRNEPHVSCDFWVEGFNMEDSSGTLVFQSWPPTGDKSVVTPTGDGLTWTADSGNSHGNYHFLNGAYQLPAGHYKVTSTDGEHKEKSKVFWVDECGTPPPPCTENCVPTPPCTVDCTQVPFFPSAVSLGLGLVGAVGAVGIALVRRK